MTPRRRFGPAGSAHSAISKLGVGVMLAAIEPASLVFSSPFESSPTSSLARPPSSETPTTMMPPNVFAQRCYDPQGPVAPLFLKVYGVAFPRSVVCRMITSGEFDDGRIQLGLGNPEEVCAEEVNCHSPEFNTIWQSWRIPM